MPNTPPGGRQFELLYNEYNTHDVQRDVHGSVNGKRGHQHGTVALVRNMAEAALVVDGPPMPQQVMTLASTPRGPDSMAFARW
eukprot:COSAG02_NODE_907_length_16005_cov_3.219252_2_plen_83_part_00